MKYNLLLGRLRPLATFLLLFLILAIVYSPAICFNFVHHDEAAFWLHLYSYKQDLADHDIIIGRYGSALLLNLQGLFVHKISDLKFLRLLAILLLSANAYLLLQQLRRFSWGFVQAFLVVLAISFLPGFADSVFYTSNVYLICSVFLACWSFCRAQELKGFLIPSIGLLFAIMVYPSGAVFYWTMVGMFMLFAQDRFGSTFRNNLFRLTAIGLISLASYAVLIHFMSFFYGHRVWNGYNPYKIDTDWLGKLHWFVHEPLINALNLWCIFPKWLTAFIVLGFIVLTTVIVFFGKLQQIKVPLRRDVLLTYLWQFGLFVFIFLLSFLPNLLAGFNAPFYRCLVPLTSLIVLMLVWSLIQGVKLIPTSKGHLILIALLSITVVYGGVKTFNNVLYYRVLPSHIETDAFRVMAQSIPFKKTDSLYIVCPNHIPEIERYDEFGVLTSQYWEDIFPLLVGAFKEDDFGDAQLPNIYISNPQDNRILLITRFITKKLPGGRAVLKNISTGDLMYLDAFKSQDNIGFVENQAEVNAGLFLRQYHPYVLNLREIFNLPNYYKLIHRNPLEKKNLSGPNDANGYNTLGTIYDGQRNFAQAVLNYTKAIELTPNIAELYLNRGNSYNRQGKLTEALKDYNKAIALKPDYTIVYEDLAVTYYQLKEYGQAWADLHKVEELDSTFPALRNALEKATGRTQ